jgi:auxin-responsive protein IAA
VQAFVKVSMDGTPYLRKVDVAAYDDYGVLVEALNEMFCCASIGKLS